MDLIDHIQKEWAVLRRAPLAFVILVVLGMVAGVGIGSWHYAGIINEYEAQISRYQVVLGIKPGSPGALVELSNQELALKAQSIVTKLRQYQREMELRGEQINSQLASKKISEAEATKERSASLDQIAEDFDNNLASDAYNVENELRSRLGAEALSHVVMVPGFVLKDANGNVIPRSRVPFMQLMRGPFESVFLSRLADEIDQMAKLLSN